MNLVQVDKVKNLIKTSRLLTDSERQEWSQLITLMNDKQIGELEEILLSLPEKTSAAAPSLGSQKQYVPPLRHISNLPASINLSSAPQAKPSVPAPRQTETKPISSWPTKLSTILEEKELPPGKKATQSPPPPPPAVRGQTASHEAVPPPIERFKVKKTENQFIPLARQTAQSHQAPPPAPIQANVRTDHGANNAPLNLNSLAEIAKLEARHLRAQGVSSLIGRLQNMAISYGYFDVLFAFEQSPLYKLYLETGNDMLTRVHGQSRSGAEDPILIKRFLTKEEFEGVTDLLLKIQVN